MTTETDYGFSRDFVSPDAAGSTGYFGYFVNGGEFNRTSGGTSGYAYPSSLDSSYVGSGVAPSVHWRTISFAMTATYRGLGVLYPAEPPDAFANSWKLVLETLADPESLLRLELMQSL